MQKSIRTILLPLANAFSTAAHDVVELVALRRVAPRAAAQRTLGDDRRVEHSGVARSARAGWVAARQNPPSSLRALHWLCFALMLWLGTGLAHAATLTVLNNNNSGTGSLRQAIADAAAGDTILFDNALSGSTIVLTSGELVISKNLNILGPGANLLAISGNHASRVFFFFNPGITNTLAGLTIKDGSTFAGGSGIFNNGTLTILNCTISGNSAVTIVGGGIYNSGVLTVQSSTISSNSATSGGGGIFNGSAASLTIENSTLAGNSTGGTPGGGIANGGRLTIRHSTITGNSAGNNRGGGIDNATGFPMTLANSIVAGNTAALFPDLQTGGGLNIPLNSNGHNFIGITNGIPSGVQPTDQTFASTGTALTNLLQTSTGIPLLKDNGGPTLTVALVSSSPANNAGDPAFAPPPDFDQRGSGFPRVVAGRLDIGALEAPSDPPAFSFCPGNLVVEATGVLTPVTFTATATNETGPVTVTCEPPSGTGFRLGTSNVVCTASNMDGVATCRFTVTVRDTTPPTVTCSTNLTVHAANTNGAVVSYLASASDVGGLGSFVCTPPSGSTFPIGITTVNCAALDASGHSNSCRFTVTVLNQCPTTANLSVTVPEGATTNFTLSATDADGDALTYRISQAPQHGVVTLQVNTGAISYSASTNYCGADSFTFRVSDGRCGTLVEGTVSINVDCGLRGQKRAVLAEIVSLRALATDSSDRKDLDDAIKPLRVSLTNTLWADNNHLVAKVGKKVFDEEAKACKELDELLEDAEDGDTTIPEAILRDWILRLVAVDRGLAVISVNEAEASGANAKKIAEDRAEIADGDRDATSGKWENALKHYRDAWSHAVKLKVTGKAAVLTATGFRLHFTGLAGEGYVLEVSTDFIHWTPEVEITADASGNIDYTDADVTAHAKKFYRVGQP